ncbi:MAG: 30S ribosomal protein S16 [Prevotellaceae bacterium]|jgi:small subunit ribosomal protein S16|nr:30S ribosomal protein S16 [Prevotellaceae bacterium]
MAVKIRLARRGKKDFAFYHIVAADSRAPRDGRFIEKLGVYNPNSNPATIELNMDRALYWLDCGAQPTDTCRSILSYKGVLLRKHLLIGVKKGAITLEVADQRFNAWLAEQEAKIQAKKDRLATESRKSDKERLEAEAKVKEATEAKLAQKRMEAAKALAAENEEKQAESTESTESDEPAAEPTEQA